MVEKGPESSGSPLRPRRRKSLEVGGKPQGENSGGRPAAWGAGEGLCEVLGTLREEGLEPHWVVEEGNGAGACDHQHRELLGDVCGHLPARRGPGVSSAADVAVRRQEGGPLLRPLLWEARH